jgi:hypothetical protein
MTTWTWALAIDAILAASLAVAIVVAVLPQERQWAPSPPGPLLVTVFALSAFVAALVGIPLGIAGTAVLAPWLLARWLLRRLRTPPDGPPAPPSRGLIEELEWLTHWVTRTPESRSTRDRKPSGTWPRGSAGPARLRVAP